MDLSERFWSKVDKSGECWIWTASTKGIGYGQIWVDGRNRSAHTLSFEMAFGSIPKGKLVDHKCHNPACVRPEHLQAVSPKQNAENRSGAQVNTTSGVRGVTWHRPNAMWMAHVTHNGKFVFCGYFDSKGNAAVAAATKRRMLFSNSLADKA